MLMLGCATTGIGPGMRNKGLEPAATTLEALSAARAPRRLAVVVGVNAYGDPAFPDLKHANHDAQMISEQLRSAQSGGFDEVVTLQDPSRSEVMGALRALADEVRREDTVMVYFSGHGTRARVGEGWRRYLLTRDSAIRDLATSAIEVESLQAWLGTLGAARRSLVVDACFDGDGKSVVAPDHEVPEESASPRLALGEAHLFATSAGRPSREDDGLGHGVYTYYLLDAMSWSFTDADVDQDGVLTAWEAHDHARSKVVAHTEGVQVPEAAIHVVGDADVVFAGAPTARDQRDRALVYLYGVGSHPLDGASLVVDGRNKGLLPGTVAIAPGRHQVTVRDAEGEVVLDGVMRFAEGRAYRVEEVQRLAQGPRSMMGWRVATASSPPLAEAIGAGAVGPELWLARRRNEGTARGLLSELSIGLAAAPARRVDGELVGATRALVWASGAMGIQHDLGRLRGRVGLGVSPVWVPASGIGGARLRGVDPYSARSEAGWWFVAAGPTMGAGWVLGRGWTAHLEARPHFGALDTDGDRVLEVVPWLVGGVGIEADL